VRDELPEEAYIDRLIEDLKIERVRAGDRPIHSIFIGGGTPSLFKPESYKRLLNAIRSEFRLEEGAEITLEANPGTFEQARFSGYRSAGINRVSIGVQTFNNAALERLGRIHNADEAIAAIKSARAIFERINIDLMHGLPEQTPEQAISDLNQAIELSPDQISWYQLTIEPNTEFAAKPPQLPIEESLWAIQVSRLQAV
jgi:oxygen-independent coproporphyrinogen-3 oxidase